MELNARTLPEGIQSGAAMMGLPEPRVKPDEIRRFSFADLNSFGPWILPRLRQRFPVSTEKEIASWLANQITANEALFICSRGAVAMFQRNFPSIGEKLTVREVFAYCTDEGLNALYAIYEDAIKWADRIGASEVAIGDASDISTRDVAKRFGKRTKTRTYTVLEIGK